jgi:hypothetical protein
MNEQQLWVHIRTMLNLCDYMDVEKGDTYKWQVDALKDAALESIRAHDELNSVINQIKRSVPDFTIEPSQNFDGIPEVTRSSADTYKALDVLGARQKLNSLAAGTEVPGNFLSSFDEARDAVEKCTVDVVRNKSDLRRVKAWVASFN